MAGTVSPAHAGIDPPRSACRASAQGLPRPRGDRPLINAAGYDPLSSPPPTRGSTVVTLEAAPAHHVSPAHAGIDPTDTDRRRE